jgi:hypothetical protein
MFVALCRHPDGGLPCTFSSARTFCRQRGHEWEAGGTASRWPLCLIYKAARRTTVAGPAAAEFRYWHGGCCLWRPGMRAMTREHGSWRPEPSPDSRRAGYPVVRGRALGRAETTHLRGTAPHSFGSNTRKECGGALTAILSMRYGPPSGVCALVAGVPFPSEEEVVVPPASVRRRGRR